MTPMIRIDRAGPWATVQDAGRPGLLRHGVSASGPMDRKAFHRAGEWLGGASGAGIEFTQTGLAVTLETGDLAISCDGAEFSLTINDEPKGWPHRAVLRQGDRVVIAPGASGNYGYVRFDREVDVPLVMGSRSTNSIASFGGLEGRALVPGDRLHFGARLPPRVALHPRPTVASDPETISPLRVIWGLHADRFPPDVRQGFVERLFTVSSRLDRMGVRLDDASRVFANTRALSLVSDAIVPGDIQILGDGTPIILMRDHQPTGGYPRIGTVIGADLDRLAQMRPGTQLRFLPVTVGHAQTLLGASR
jgi:5-oxoprolinase (ATP-hydrolysing) subunit C